jgi:aminoglycoside phosphotransferase (APT) family kinase protein
VAIEQGWQRRFAFVQLSSAEIETLVQSYAKGAIVLEATPLGGGLRNTNYRLHLSVQEQPVVLRVYSADPSACRREALLLRTVEATVPVPRVLHAEPDADPPWAITTWLDGTRFDQFLLTASEKDVETASFSAGQILAKIHVHTFPESGFFAQDLSIEAPISPDSGWRGILENWLLRGNTGRKLGTDLTRCLLRFVADNAWRTEPIWTQSQLVHADYKPWNLLVKDNAIVAVLDWEFAFAGFALNDFAIYLRYSHTQIPAYKQAFVDGYQAAGGALPADWPRLTKLVDLVSLCYFLERPGDDPAVVRDVRPLIETTLKDFAP